MRYVLLIYGVEAHLARLTPEEMGAFLAEWGRFRGEIEAAGIIESNGRLRPIASASTVRVRGGKATTTDGPFAETKEQLGGFYLVNVPSLDEALAWARKIPSSKHGAVEVRPIWELEEYTRSP